MQPVQAFTMENWEEQVLLAEGLVLVDFQAPWCGPSFQEDLAKEGFWSRWGMMVRAGWVDVSRFADLAILNRIHKVPTLALFNRGRILRSFMGPSRIKQISRRLFQPLENPEQVFGKIKEEA